MNYAHFIRDMGKSREGARDLARDEARQLFGAMLDGGVPELELGAIVTALRLIPSCRQAIVIRQK